MIYYSYNVGQDRFPVIDPAEWGDGGTPAFGHPGECGI